MPSVQASPWLHRFAVLTAASTLFLIWVGGLVTSHGVGMAVPDWPTTYGYNMFFFPFSQWVGGIFYEHSHRLVASTVGMLTAILTAWIWTRESSGWARRIGLIGIGATLGLMGVRRQEMFVALALVAAGVLVFAFVRCLQDQRKLRWLAVMAFCVVLIQGVLGGLRVTAMKNEIGIFHGTLAQIFFALLCSIALVTSRWWMELNTSVMPVYGGRRLRYAFAGVTILILFQLMLGATMRHQHAGLAIPDFPTAYGELWPDMSPQAIAGYNQMRGEVMASNPITAFQVGLQMAHRIVAVAILVAVAWLAGAARRRFSGTAVSKLATFWLALILIQASLGAFTIWTNKAADIATAHVAFGALCLVTGVMVSLVCVRLTGDAETVPHYQNNRPSSLQRPAASIPA